MMYQINSSSVDCFTEILSRLKMKKNLRIKLIVKNDYKVTMNVFGKFLYFILTRDYRGSHIDFDLDSVNMAIGNGDQNPY